MRAGDPLLLEPSGECLSILGEGAGEGERDLDGVDGSCREAWDRGVDGRLAPGDIEVGRTARLGIGDMEFCWVGIGETECAEELERDGKPDLANEVGEAECDVEEELVGDATDKVEGAGETVGRGEGDGDDDCEIASSVSSSSV